MYCITTEIDLAMEITDAIYSNLNIEPTHDEHLELLDHVISALNLNVKGA